MFMTVPANRTNTSIKRVHNSQINKGYQYLRILVTPAPAHPWINNACTYLTSVYIASFEDYK